ASSMAANTALTALVLAASLWEVASATDRTRSCFRIFGLLFPTGDGLRCRVYLRAFALSFRSDYRIVCGSGQSYHTRRDQDIGVTRRCLAASNMSKDPATPALR